MLLVLGSLGAPALAQEDPAGGAPVEEAPAEVGEAYNFDRLLITTVQPEDVAWKADADALMALLVARFTRSNAVVSMAEVPSFDVQGYDAATYMLGCPPGQYSGCALVLGQRAEADRAIGATLRREQDDLEEGGTIAVATFHVVDVMNSREVVSFAVPIPKGTEEKVVEGLAGLFDEVVRGDYELEDLRQREDTNAEELEAARREKMAAALQQLESDLGTAVVTEDVGIVHAPKVTKADLAEYAQRDDTPPWEQLRMSQGEYLRFANSGATYAEWRRAGWGRTTRILLRVGGGVGSGPFHQRYASQVLLSGETLQPVDQAQLLEVTQGSSATGDFELGFGVLPWLEVAFAAAVHTGQTTVSSDEDVEGQVPLPTDDTISALSTWSYGPRLALAPFPRWPARPTLGAGFALWKGGGVPESDRFGRLEAPTASFLEIAPGAEVSASESVVPWARVLVAVPLGGTLFREDPSAGVMTNAPVATGTPGTGLSFQAGLQFRIGPLVKPPSRSAGPTFDEP